jgi:hypothetical protein
MMRDFAGHVVGTIVKVIIFGTIAVFAFGEIVHLLWNWLMPALFHLPLITFWQAWGLMALGWILFGGLRGGGRRGWGNGGSWRRGMQGRWEKMSPEEREKMREWMRSRCGHVPADAAPKA